MPLYVAEVKVEVSIQIPPVMVDFRLYLSDGSGAVRGVAEDAYVHSDTGVSHDTFNAVPAGVVIVDVTVDNIQADNTEQATDKVRGMLLDVDSWLGDIFMGEDELEVFSYTNDMITNININEVVVTEV